MQKCQSIISVGKGRHVWTELKLAGMFGILDSSATQQIHDVASTWLLLFSTVLFIAINVFKIMLILNTRIA